MKDSTIILIATFLLGMIMGALILMITALILVKDIPDYDYKMELDYNKIHITNDDSTYIIEPDSLEEFIEQDNL